jgi:hypothetical protein
MLEAVPPPYDHARSDIAGGTVMRAASSRGFLASPVRRADKGSPDSLRQPVRLRHAAKPDDTASTRAMS